MGLLCLEKRGQSVLANKTCQCCGRPATVAPGSGSEVPFLEVEVVFPAEEVLFPEEEVLFQAGEVTFP